MRERGWFCLDARFGFTSRCGTVGVVGVDAAVSRAVFVSGPGKSMADRDRQCLPVIPSNVKSS